MKPVFSHPSPGAILVALVVGLEDSPVVGLVVVGLVLLVGKSGRLLRRASSIVGQRLRRPSVESVGDTVRSRSLGAPGGVPPVEGALSGVTVPRLADEEEAC